MPLSFRCDPCAPVRRVGAARRLRRFGEVSPSRLLLCDVVAAGRRACSDRRETAYCYFSSELVLCFPCKDRILVGYQMLEETRLRGSFSFA